MPDTCFCPPTPFNASSISRLVDGEILFKLPSNRSLSLLMDVKIRFYYTYCNEKKATLLMEHPELATDPMIAFMDMTDRENPAFQYAR
jgi:hypothetical protein